MKLCTIASAVNCTTLYRIQKKIRAASSTSNYEENKPKNHATFGIVAYESTDHLFRSATGAFVLSVMMNSTMSLEQEQTNSERDPSHKIVPTIERR